MGLNLHLYPSPITYESRIMKATKSLLSLEAFSEIHVVGIHREGLKEHDSWDNRRKIWRVPSGKPWPIPKLKSISRFVKWAYKIICRYHREDVAVIQCHSLEDLPIGILMRIGRNDRRLVYDAHELETERNGLKGLNQKVAKLKERVLIRFVDEVLVVSESIGVWYKDRYQLDNVSLVRNAPYNHSQRFAEAAELDRSVFRRKFGIQDDATIFLYQGAFMKGRCIELMLDVFSELEEDKHIVFMGYGVDYERLIQDYAARRQNIHYQEAVSPQEVHHYTVGADVGLCVYEATCLSYYYALPNKLYEYTLAGMPVIANNFPEMARVIKEFDNGWTVEVKKESVINLINRLTPDKIEEKRRNSIKAQERIGWHHEEKALLDVYRRLI